MKLKDSSRSGGVKSLIAKPQAKNERKRKRCPGRAARARVGFAGRLRRGYFTPIRTLHAGGRASSGAGRPNDLPPARAKRHDRLL